MSSYAVRTTTTIVGTVRQYHPGGPVHKRLNAAACRQSRVNNEFGDTGMREQL
jgi:hypothetical protein